ncbi:glycosyltransferase [Labilibacter marinus]|uniref:glycosyltransferase n=1 Tax=Labilibacter marinus TaxID=1477105 RepID=UPI00094F8580|nr:glycosyltransferase [Labilibacter marinus]
MTIDQLTNIPFSLVSTVFNEVGRLSKTISNIEAQTLLPAEIIITDAGSNDGTYQQLLRWKKESLIKITILQEKGCNVARGRNLAIKEAHTDIIVSTDFGCFHSPNWLRSIISPFNEDKQLEVVGGAYGVLEKDVNTTSAKAEYIIQNGYNIPLDKTFIVSSRSIAYKKQVWQQLNGYPEWLTLAGDDSTFWKLILRKGFKYKISEDVHVFWQRHESLIGFKKEAYRYGLGDGESVINVKNTISHLIETGLRYTFFISLITWLCVMIYPGLVNSSIPQDSYTLKPIFYFLIFITLISIAGLRSYLWSFKNWLKLKSSKYHVGVLFYSFYMTEHLRWSYLNGYFKGYFRKSELQKKRAEQQKAQLGKYVG